MAPRKEMRTPLGVLWVDPDKRSLGNLEHHLSQPGGFLVTSTEDRFVQAARVENGLILEYKDRTHQRTRVAEESAALAAFEEFWTGSAEFVTRHSWEPVPEEELTAPPPPRTPATHETVNELLADALNPRLTRLGFTANRTATRFRHKSAHGEQTLQLSITRSKGVARIAARADIALTEVDNQVEAWGVHLDERPKLTVHSDMCWPDAAKWDWSVETDDTFLKVSLEAFAERVIVPLNTDVEGIVSTWENLGLKHAGTRVGQIGLAAAFALVGDRERAVTILQTTAGLRDSVGNEARALLSRL